MRKVAFMVALGLAYVASDIGGMNMLTHVVMSWPAELARAALRFCLVCLNASLLVGWQEELLDGKEA